ncbi:39S ribosomal protein L52, mitochondrial [Aphelenchoides besseyi]|nr:39S ribosomal protein L52, mitochondrial [Aphelenchoides besseyi]
MSKVLCRRFVGMVAGNPNGALKKSTNYRYQWWNEPVYVQPIPHPLQVGPDYSFLDGRKPRITSYPEFKRREEQVELGAQIVKCLKEVNEAERMYSQHKQEQEKESRYRETWTLSSKGDSLFS